MIDFVKNKDFLAKINQCDQDSFLALYNFYAPKLFRHIYYRVNSKETAEDLAQQVFFKTWQYLSQAENQIDNINAFLYRTATNLITDYYRSSARKDLALENVEEKKFASQPSYIDEIDNNLTVKKIKQALVKLPAEKQQLIIWRYLDNLSIAEISQLSGKSKNAVYVGLHRALRELKKIIKNHEN